jgi:hypothetical protein
MAAGGACPPVADAQEACCLPLSRTTQSDLAIRLSTLSEVRKTSLQSKVNVLPHFGRLML